MSLKFGTDGVRAVANTQLTPEFALDLGRAAGLWIREHGLEPCAVIGRDTRQSGSMLGAAFAAGMTSAGISVDTLGQSPTGAIAYTARSYSLGAVISASHNPAPDNGIKLIAGDGGKISDETEQWITAHLGQADPSVPEGGAVGAITPNATAHDDYLAFLAAIVPERLEGMKVVIDAAHGAAYDLGVRIFRTLGAAVTAMGTEPDGVNINAEGGATKPEALQEAMQREGADLGVAYDGDADRAVFADKNGTLVNGDRMMAIWCAHWKGSERFQPEAVVGTVMSNGGFAQYMAGNGIAFHRAKVGDKHVSLKLREINGKIGGEQSGHIIFPDHGPTGDGLVTALELARVLKREGKSLDIFADDFANWPQLLVNLSVDRKDGWESNQTVQNAISNAEAALGDRGRVNVRASGTQPIIRVMVEADEEALRDQQSDQIVQGILGELGGEIYSRVDLTHALGD